MKGRRAAQSDDAAPCANRLKQREFRASPGHPGNRLTLANYRINRIFNRRCYRPPAWGNEEWTQAAHAAPTAYGSWEMAIDMSMPVLVVDDYNTMIRIIRNLLKQLGFEDVDDASDGSAALTKLRGKKYGLVISDWNMEPMTGYELLKEVRADPGLTKMPFIMVTAESKTENVIAAKKAGVNNYIVKPFNAQTLKTKIEAVFAE
jgi:two-component system chemotaxis response regulator CheY